MKGPIIGVVAGIAVFVVGIGIYWYLRPIEGGGMPKPTPVTTEQQAMVANTSYSLDDVAKHASETDCWLAIDGGVYDVTTFVLRHPGGRIILNGCGKDASAFFNMRPNGKGPHSENARKMLESMRIGSLK